MKIEILGAGCAKCEALAKQVEEAIAALGVDATIAKVTDIVEIADRGVMLTPALSVDGEIVLVGKVPTLEKLKRLLGGTR